MAKFIVKENFTAQPFIFDRPLPNPVPKDFKKGDKIEASEQEDFGRQRHLVSSDGYDIPPTLVVADFNKLNPEKNNNMDQPTNQLGEATSTAGNMARPVNRLQAGTFILGSAAILGSVAYFGLNKNIGITIAAALLGAGFGFYADAKIQSGQWFKG